MESPFSKSWFRAFALVVMSTASFFLLIKEVPEWIGRGEKGIQSEPSIFYSSVLQPVSPNEVVVIKRSGEEFPPPSTSFFSRAEPLNSVKLNRSRVASFFPPSLSGSEFGSGESIDPVFRKSPALVPMVEFWKRIFSLYTKEQVVVHHRDHVELVYSVLDFSTLQDLPEAEVKRLRERLIASEREGIFARVKARAARGDLPAAEREILDDPELIRTQTGIRNAFGRAIALSGQYMPYMENIFREEGVPTELTCLPFIESAFNLRAMSSVGALGIWQFMESTGKGYMRVDSEVDERRDPLISTYAAAQFLKEMYEKLGSWPLVVNAYNTGAGRMMQAVSVLGTEDIAEIITRFEEPGYQFSSRNFYPEFLAALEIYRDRETLFEEVEEMAPLRYDTVLIERPLSLPLLANLSGTSLAELADLNPSLSESFFDGTKLLSTDFLLKVPYASGERVSSFLLADLGGTRYGQ